MAEARSFPALVPTGRSYTPGVFPEQQFQSQNGSVIRVQYGNQRYSSSLSLTFANITDASAASILENYVAVMGDDKYVVFTDSNVAAGVSTVLVPWIQETNSLLRWKYASPPSVESIKPELSTVTCEFIGELEGV